MTKKLLVTFLIAYLSFSTGFAQINPNNTLEFSTGYNIGSLKNLEYAPLARYDYKGLVYKLGFERTTKKKNIFSVQFDFLQSELTSDLVPALNLDYDKIGLDVSYLKLAYGREKLSIYAGLHARSEVSIYAKEAYNRSVIDQSIGLGSQFSYKINKRQVLFSKLSVPIVIFRATNSDSGIYSFNRYQSILWNIGYTHALSDRNKFKLSYDFNYDRLQISNSFREVQYQFNLGLIFKF